MIPYILHVTMITTICFLFYKLLLQKETFYRLNRWTLMGCLAVSFALPLLPVPREWSWRDKWKETATADQPPVAVQREVVKETVSVSSEPVGKEVPVLQSAPVSQDRPKRHGHHAGAGARAAGNGSKPPVAPMTTANELRSAATVPVTTAANPQGTATVDKRTMATVERPTMAAVSGVADAVSKSSKTTTGTPAEKNGAGTLARFFSGAMLLLALQWLFYCYLFGVVLFGARFLLQLTVLLYQSYSRPVIKDGRFRIVEISGNRAPCSFGNTIFINPEKYDWETYNQILIHEKIHVSGHHTLDILLAEVALVIQWFNPFAWLYRREVENNLEFLTDANVLLDQAIERSAYQLSLLRVSAPHLPFSITNNYNQSLLKRRIVMMNSQRSSLSTVWKYFFLLPLLIGLMCVLNKPAAALGAATTKLSMAHAPLFNFIAPIHDTTKRPVKSPDSASTEIPAPVKASRSSSGEGASEGAGYSESYGNSSGDGNSTTIALGDAYGYGTAITIKGDADPNPQAMAMTVDAYNRAFQPMVKVKTFTKNVSVDGERVFKLGPINAEVRAAVDARVDADVKVIDLSRYVFMDDSVLVDGSWYATSYGDRLSFELKAGDDDHYWNYTIHVDKSEINPFPGQGNVEFKLVREAGTIVFKGQFDGQEGFGHFHFAPDAAYLPALKQMGVEDMEDRRQFGFFAMNIKKDYVNMLVHNGYPHISQRDLLSFAAMHIDEAYIQYWHGVDLGEGDANEPRTLIRLKAMHIDRAYVDELKAAGYDHLSLRELESLKAQHIDKDYIRSLSHGLNNQPIPVRELVSYKALHIDSAYLEGLRKIGYDNLTTRDITSLYSMHVTPEYIQQLQGLGYKDLTARDLTSLMAMHINPDYIKGFRDIGYTDLSPRDLSNLKAMNITPEFIKSYQGLGYKNLTVRTLDNLKSMNVTPEFIKGFADAGYTDLTANELSSLKSMGITPDFVAGFNKLGFDHISVRVLTSLKASGVTPEYVTRMRAQGFDSKDLNKYIRLKTDFN